MRFKLYILAVTLFWPGFSVFGQEQKSADEAFFDEMVGVVNNQAPGTSLNYIDSILIEIGNDSATSKYSTALFFRGYVKSYIQEEFTSAINIYRRALNLLQSVTPTNQFNTYMQAITLSNIGTTLSVIEDLEGIHYLQQSNDVFKRLGQNRKIASNYRNIAKFFENSINSEPILFFHDRARYYIMQDSNYSRTSLAYTYRGISNVFDNTNKDSALYYMKLACKTLNSDTLAQDADRLNLAAGAAELALRYKRYDMAHEYASEAMKLTKSLYGKQSIVFAHMCFQWVQIYGHQKMYDSAEHYRKLGFEIYDKQGEKYIWKINAYNHLKEIEKQRGNFNLALKYAHKAMFINAPTMAEPENVDELLPLDTTYYSFEKLGNAIFNKLELYILLYKQTHDFHYLKMAFEASQHLFNYLFHIHYKNSISLAHTSPAFSESVNKTVDLFLWIMAEAQRKKFDAIDLKNGYELFSRLKAALLREQIQNTLSSNNLKSVEIALKIDSIRNKTQQLNFIKKYEKINTDSILSINNQLEKNYIDILLLRNRNRKNQEPSIQPAEEEKTLSIFQKIGEKQAILDYYFNDSALFCFVVDNNHVQLMKTPIDNKFSNLLTNTIRQLKTISTQFPSTSNELYNYLINSIYSHISKNESLIIIPYGQLFNLPFEILQNDRQQFLIETFAISYHYTSLNKMHQKIPKVEKILAFAPGFKNNPGISSTTRGLLTDSESRGRLQFIDEHRGTIAPLPFAQKEVERIKKVLGNKAHITAGSDATETAFKQQVKGFDIVHIASHGYSSVQNPELSGVFFIDNSEIDDGYLFANEIYELDINADLVVLSACQTGKGRIESIEGALSLPRAFIAKGVRNVLASLWKVDDKNTMKLMQYFYENLAKGKNYTEALQLAKERCIVDGMYTVDWSGFVLFGE